MPLLSEGGGLGGEGGRAGPGEAEAAPTAGPMREARLAPAGLPTAREGVPFASLVLLPLREPGLAGRACCARPAGYWVCQHLH